MKKILLLILCVALLGQISQMFGMEQEEGSAQYYFPSWCKLPLELQANVLERDMTSLILSRQFKLLQERLHDLQSIDEFKAILDYMFNKNNKWINDLVDSINDNEINPISKLALAQILLDDTQFNQFIKNNDINLNHADQRGIQLLDFPWKGPTIIDSKVVQTLIKQGINLNLQDNDGQTALMHTIRYDQLKAAHILIDAGANLDLQDNDGNTALMHTAANGDTDTVKILIDAGVDINLKSNKGRTALMYASRVEIVQMLIKAGANLDLQDNDDQWTALMHATWHKRPNIVKTLIAAGVDINVQGNGKYTALMQASRVELADIVQMLIKARANLNLQDEYGRTALMYAARFVHTEIVKMLIAAGADLSLQDNEGKTALMYARTDIIKALIAAKAK